MFGLDEQQQQKFAEWNRNHKKECKFFQNEDGIEQCGAIGGRLTYSFTPTGLGVITKIQCACGAEIDLTDVEDW
jgi:hypothetical protein